MNSPPTWDTALTVGGWDSRYATVLAIGRSHNGAVVVLDPNSDGADINVDSYNRDSDGTWHPGSSGNGQAGWHGGVAFTSGEAAPGGAVVVDFSATEWHVPVGATGWWVFVADMPELTTGALPRRVR